MVCCKKLLICVFMQLMQAFENPKPLVAKAPRNVVTGSSTKKMVFKAVQPDAKVKGGRIVGVVEVEKQE